MENQSEIFDSITHSELVTPKMTNSMGTLFGGDLLAHVDKAAYVCARRYCKQTCVTASFDQVSFLGPVHIDELITYHARIIHVGKSSMLVEINVYAENLKKDEVRKVSTCFATMVAIKDGKPVEVPRMKCDTIDECRDRLMGDTRRKLAKEYAQRISSAESNILNLDNDELEKMVNGLA